MAGGRYQQLDAEERVLNESWLDVLRVSALVAALAVLVWAVCTALRWVVHEGTHTLFAMVMEHGLLGAWALLALLALGGFVRILLIRKFGWGEAAGDGMAEALGNYHITYECDTDDPQPRYSRPTFGLAVRKVIMTLLTLLTGASGGLESPVVLIAESLGAGWARLTRTVSEHELRTYQLSAIGAAVGALLGAPFAAALFATEIAYADRIIYRKFAYALFAAIIAYMLNNHVAGFDPLFVAAPHDRIYSFTEYGVTSLVAVAVSAPIALGFGFLMTLGRGVTARSGTFAVGILAPIAAGAIALALWWGLGLELQHVLGGGEATIHDLLNPVVHAEPGHGDEHHAIAHPLGLSSASLGLWWVLLIALVGRMLTTGLTLQSGGSAGLLIPAMVMGGVGGAVVGQLIQLTGLFPPMDVTPFVVSGIASALVAVVGVPLAAIALVLEVFGAAYGPPAILAVGLTYVLTVRFTVYRTQRVSSPSNADEADEPPAGEP
ncbi:MAG: chloride channel protein [Myxococcota bacterium]